MVADLTNLSLDELKKLRKDVDMAIENFEARKREAALAELKDVDKKHGFDLQDLASGKGKTAKTVSPAKYRDPAEPSNTWTGRGRKPNWLMQALAEGKSLEDFAI